MDYQYILDALPYSDPFLFVDGLDFISEESIKGHYTFRENAFFYSGHFKDFPITPGVILAECAAQIGVVCLGIYLLPKGTVLNNLKIALSEFKLEFLKPVFPGECVYVESKKEYFRFNKLKCSVAMKNENNEIVCKGYISGMLKINA